MSGVLRDRHQELLFELSSVISSATDFRDIFEVFASRMKEETDVEQILISSVDLSASTYTPVYFYGDQREHMELGKARVLTGSAHEIAIQTKAPLLLTQEMIASIDWSSAPGGIDPFPQFVSWIVSPLIIAAQPVGMLMFRSSSPNAYGTEQIELAGRISSQIAGAFANWQRLQVAERETEIRMVLADLGRITNMALDIGDIYDELARNVARIIPLDRLAVETYSESFAMSTQNYVFGTPIAERHQGAVLNHDQELMELVRSTKSPVIIDADFIERYPVVAQHLDHAKQHGLRSWIFAPLVWRDEVIGALQYQNEETDYYNSEHLRIAGLVADQISGAIASSSAYQNERRERNIREALASISFVVSRDLKLANVYHRVADELERLISYDRLVIAVFDPETKALTLDFVRGVELPGESPGDDITDAVLPRTWQSYMEEVGEIRKTERGRAFIELGLQSWIQAPIGMQARGPDGFLSLRSRNASEYSEADADLLDRIAAQITPAIQNARLYEQSIKLSMQRELSRNLDEKNIELQRIADARSDFLSTVSHELRTPLTSISAFTDILSRNQSENLSVRQIEQLAIVRRSTDSLTELIDDLLDVSRADTGRLDIAKAPFEIQDFFLEFTTDAERMIDSRNQSLIPSNVRKPTWINADGGKIVQILNNLVSNASKYSPPGSEIAVSAKIESGKLKVEVIDWGMGISTNDLANVFTPFFRASNPETQQESGTGLGLAIVKSLVSLHGGEVELESTLGEGTKVRFWIPGITSPPDQISIG